MSKGWGNNEPEVELARCRRPGAAITADSFQAVDGDWPDIRLPEYRDGRTPALHMRNAHAGTVATARKIDHRVSILLMNAVDDSILITNAESGLRPSGAALHGALPGQLCRPQEPASAMAAPEYHPSTSPRRIWNGASLHLQRATLMGSGFRVGPAPLAPENVKPEAGDSIPVDIPEPRQCSLELPAVRALAPQTGLVFKPRLHKPAALDSESRVLAPRLKVPLPSPPPLR